jgi:hypothetical protein
MDFLKYGFIEFWISENLDSRMSGFHDFVVSQKMDFLRYRFLKFWIYEFLDFRFLGLMDFCISKIMYSQILKAKIAMVGKRNQS